MLRPQILAPVRICVKQDAARTQRQQYLPIRRHLSTPRSPHRPPRRPVPPTRVDHQRQNPNATIAIGLAPPLDLIGQKAILPRPEVQVRFRYQTSFPMREGRFRTALVLDRLLLHVNE